MPGVAGKACAAPPTTIISATHSATGFAMRNHVRDAFGPGNGEHVMTPCELVKLTALMERTSGSSEVKIGFIDGPVVTKHPDLSGANLRKIKGNISAACVQADSAACLHGTFVAGVLSARRNSPAPAICPNCTLLIHPIFAETTSGKEQMPHAAPGKLADAIIQCINDGARIINLSLALSPPSTKGERALEEGLNQAVKHGVIIVAAAGNKGTIGSSLIIRHPWVIPVVACDWRGRPLNESNLSCSIGRRGLRAPGDGITSLGAEGQPLTLGGTSVAAPFVTGAIALVWSEYPSATAAQIRFAVTRASATRRASVVPPLLDAEAISQNLLKTDARRWTA